MRPNLTARSSPSYLLHTPYSYYFRMKIPKDLRLQFDGKTEIKRSLQTGYLSEAKFKARVLAGQFQRFFRYLRGKDGKIMATKLTEDLLNDIITEFVQSWSDRFEDKMLEDRKRPLNEDELENMEWGTVRYMRQVKKHVQNSHFTAGFSQGPRGGKPPEAT